MHHWSSAKQMKHARESSPCVALEDPRLAEAQVTWWLGRRSSADPEFICLWPSSVPRSSCHSHTAWLLPLCTLETAAAPRETFREQTPNLGSRHKIFAEKISLNQLTCRRIRDVRGAPNLRAAVAKTCRGAKPKGWAPSEGAVAPRSQQQSYSHKLTYSLYSYSH